MCEKLESLKMAKVKGVVINTRTFSSIFKPVLAFSLIICLNNARYASCYSNVRRSGSTSSIDELKRYPVSKDSPNISPMLRPLSAKGSDHSSQSYDIEIKHLDSIKSNMKNNSSQNDFKTKKNSDKIEEYNEFKPISSSLNIDDYIPKQKKDLDEKKYGKDEKKKSSEKVSLLKQIGDAIELAEDGVTESPEKQEELYKLERELLGYVDETLSKDSYNLFEGVNIEPVISLRGRDLNVSANGAPRSLNLDDFDNQVIEKLKNYAKNHVLSVNLPQTARFFGFKSFGLKKLLLPIFIGAQIVKSVLIAMFLPSILGSLGKIVGKGLSQFSGASASFGQPHVQMDDLDYKDAGYAEGEAGYTYPNTDTVGTINANTLYGGKEDLANVAMSRFGPGGAKVTYLPSPSDNYYRTAYKKQEDYKVFHNIPASSLLLSNYDPFYSPLLSRLDSVFQRLGLGGTAGPAQEACREKLVCMMYSTPAKYAPYSNLVSAQLSRELNELRKPTSDNPEILRFFRYMKAAKDGQERGRCARSYPNCPALTQETGSAAMITTYNDINKLVAARKL